MKAVGSQTLNGGTGKGRGGVATRSGCGGRGSRGGNGCSLRVSR